MKKRGQRPYPPSRSAPVSRVDMKRSGKASLRSSARTTYDRRVDEELMSAVGRLLVRLSVAGGVIGGAFALGLLFGEEGVSSDGTAEAGIERIDALTSRYQEVKDQLRLTFHDELGGPARQAAGPLDEQQEALPVLSVPQRVSSVAEKPTPDPLPEAAPPKTEAVAATPAAATPVAATPAAATPAAAAPVAAAPDVGAPVESTPAETDSPRPEGRARLAAALTSVLGDDAPAWARSDEEPAPRVAQAQAPEHRGAAAPKADQPAPGGFVIQVASLPERASAERLAARLQGAGHRVRLEAAAVPSGQTWRVFVVGHTNQASAEVARDAVKSAFGLTGFVRAAR